MIRELRFPTECVTHELAAELADNGRSTLLQQIVAKPVKASNLFTVWQSGTGVNRRTRRVLIASAADGVESLQCESKRVDALVTLGTRHITAVTFDQLSLSQPFWNRLGQGRHIFGRSRQLFTQQNFADPVAAQDRARARYARLLGKCRRQSQDPTAAEFSHPFDPLPSISVDVFDSIKCGQTTVHKRVIGIQQAE